MTREEAKQKLDTVINKSRVHFYKPIQIAEILYHQRTVERDMDLTDLESYRTRSKHWRDDVTSILTGNVSTSSARYQDDLFHENAVPPAALFELGKENIRTNGAVEAYIYRAYLKKNEQLKTIWDYCVDATPDDFDVKHILDYFWEAPGLKRSIDKVLEIVTYALIEAFVVTSEAEVQVCVAESKLPLLTEFEQISRQVLNLTSESLAYTQKSHVYRVGVANAADRGLDMYTDWGVTIQVKHKDLNVKLAKEIAESVSSDRIVIVCKRKIRGLDQKLERENGWQRRICGILTEEDLVQAYEKAMRGTFGAQLGNSILEIIRNQFKKEFPFVAYGIEALADRRYGTIHDAVWNGLPENHD